MLSRQQWQWFADNYKKVRIFCLIGFTSMFTFYMILVVYTGVEKGKSWLPYAPQVSVREKFNCDQKIKEYRVIHHVEPMPKINQANGWLLERYYAFAFDADWSLKVFPECLGATLADLKDNPNPFVISVYDTQTNRLVYKITRE